MSLRANKVGVAIHEVQKSWQSSFVADKTQRQRRCNTLFLKQHGNRQGFLQGEQKAYRCLLKSAVLTGLPRFELRSNLAMTFDFLIQAA
ncbi:MAG: hypothetical protein IKZ88_04540 [Neisseriaceae bacterium]|nr:hypothetical protein [Neisseriaceae bacterium]